MPGSSHTHAEPSSVQAARTRRQALRRKIGAVLIIAGVCLGAVVTRAVWHGRQALARGDQAMALGQPRAAIDHWRRAARWYVPLAPHVGDAYQRLESLARAAETGGDESTALAAWRGVRNSVMSTRGLYTPHQDHLDRANDRIAALMSRAELAAAATGTRATSPDQRAHWHRAALTRVIAPSPWWFAIAFLGLAMWLGGALLFALRAVRPDDTLAWRTAARAGALVLSGLVLWMMGLYLA